MSRHTTEKWDRTDRDDISIQTAVEILKIHITLYLTRIKVNFQSMDIPKYLIDTGLSLLGIYIHILEKEKYERNECNAVEKINSKI